MWLNEIKSFQVKHNFQEEIQVSCLTGHQDLVFKNHVRCISSNRIFITEGSSMWGLYIDDRLLRLH